MLKYVKKGWHFVELEGGIFTTYQNSTKCHPFVKASVKSSYYISILCATKLHYNYSIIKTS